MNIVLAAHHFLPRYVAGVELHTYRLARWLLRHGHNVQVVCVESVTDREFNSTLDVYDEIPVHRLHLGLQKIPGPLSLQFWNPDIGKWFGQFLSRMRPDIVHINSMYLLSANTALAAKESGYPLVIALHDYWALCPLITLLRPDGSLCDALDDAVECAWCLMMLQRRYRLLGAVLYGVIGRLVKRALAHPIIAPFLGWQQRVNTVGTRQSLLRRVLGQADAVVVATHFLKNMLVRSGYAEEIKIVICPYGLDISGWNPVAVTPGDAHNLLRIGYIGQITYQKGVHLLIQAFNRLKGSARIPELKIYGDLRRFPHYAAWLERLAEGNPRVIFAGTYDNKDTPRVFAGIDVLVVPSIWYEGAPLVIAEAFATKTPVVAAGIGGMAELLRHEVNGLVFRAGSVEDLVTHLQRLLDDVDLLNRLRQGIGEVRSIDDEMAQLMGIYNSLVVKNRGPVSERFSESAGLDLA